MEVHLRELFGTFQQQFGIGPGLGHPGSRAAAAAAAAARGRAPPPSDASSSSDASSGASSSGAAFSSSAAPPLSSSSSSSSSPSSSPSLPPHSSSSIPPPLTRIDGASTSFIKAIFRASAALHRSNPWKLLRPSHLFGVRVGHSSQPFSCALFVGGSGLGDLGLHLFRSQPDALAMAASRGFIPSPGFLRLSFSPEADLPSSHKKMIKSLNLEIVGPKAFPSIDLVYPASDGFPSFRNPTLEELRWLYACLRAITQIHASLQPLDTKGHGLTSVFEEFVQTVDVQWPAEDAKFWEITSVKVTHPPRDDQDEQSSHPPKLAEHMEATVDLADWSIPRQCAMCEKEVPANVAPRCSRCKAVIYCGHACQKKHWKEQHKGSCELYRAMMEREEELEMSGFLFPCLMEHACKWLESVGLHGKGMWRRMCECSKHCPFGLLPPLEGGGSGLPGAWGMEHGKHPSDTPLLDYVAAGDNPSTMILSCWAEYYDVRALPMFSPVAALLSFPLSLYHIVTSLSVATKNSLAKGREVVVHYLGPEGELDWLPAFSELGHLLGGSGSLHIMMIGPEVPNSLSGGATSLGRKLKFSFVQGVYQEEASSLPSPQVVVALNAGLESYSSWMGALEVIKAQNVPAFFTDYAEPCCANAKQVLRAAGLHISYPVTPNPFRSPVKNQIPSSNLPWFSNGFVLGVNT